MGNGNTGEPGNPDVPTVVEWRKAFYWVTPSLSANAQHLAFALSMHMNPAGRCRVGHRTLSRLTGHGRHCVAARIAELVARDFLEIVAKGVGTAATEYQALTPSSAIGTPLGPNSGAIETPLEEAGKPLAARLKPLAARLDTLSGAIQTPKQEPQAFQEQPHAREASSADRELAEAEARRRQAAGTQIRSFGAYVESIMRDPKTMARLQSATPADWVTAGVADRPRDCRHRHRADLGDVIRCAGCGQEWPKAGADAP